MNKWMKWSSYVACWVLLCGLAMASETMTKAKAYDVGSVVEPFSLKNVEGKEVNLADVLGKQIVVLDFWNCQCPVSRAYETRLIELQKKYSTKEIAFFAVDSNSNNDEKMIKDYAAENKLTYPVLKDWNNVIADKFEAAVTPHVFIIGKDKMVKYIGPIDDSQDTSKVKSKLVENALDALLAGKEVTVTKQKPFGCAIKRVASK